MLTTLCATRSWTRTLRISSSICAQHLLLLGAELLVAPGRLRPAAGPALRFGSLGYRSCASTLPSDAR